MLYGIPYKGSKTKIAESIVSILPGGKRFVDLFGGGFAMSHAALISGKYGTICFNEIDTTIVDCIKKAILGFYDYETFVPEWVNREKFDKLKRIDGYVKTCWSFGSNCVDYMYSRDKEYAKESIHNFIVYGDNNRWIKENIPKYNMIKTDNIIKRMLYLNRLNNSHTRLQHLEKLQRLQRLQNLSGKIEMHDTDYRKYVYRKGDIVYCDIPYQDTSEYKTKFDNETFYRWVLEQPFEIYFSSYPLYDKRFTLIWARKVISTYSATSNNIIKIECLYKT